MFYDVDIITNYFTGQFRNKYCKISKHNRFKILTGRKWNTFLSSEQKVIGSNHVGDSDFFFFVPRSWHDKQLHLSLSFFVFENIIIAKSRTDFYFSQRLQRRQRRNACYYAVFHATQCVTQLSARQVRFGTNCPVDCQCNTAIENTLQAQISCFYDYGQKLALSSLNDLTKSDECKEILTKDIK